MEETAADLAAAINLMTVFSMVVPEGPEDIELKNTLELEERLLDDLFENYTDNKPNKGPVEVLPYLFVDHIRAINEDKGLMSLYCTLQFTWVDKRLKWKPAAYGGLEEFVRNKYDLFFTDIWTPQINIADLNNRNIDITTNGNWEVSDIKFRFSGHVRVTTRILVRTTCDFRFGAYPNDYQNCSFTLFSYQDASQFQFTPYGSLNLGKYTRYMKVNGHPFRVGDFEIAELKGEPWYLFLGYKAVKDINKIYPQSAYSSFFRYTIKFRRTTTYFFSKFSMNLIIACGMVTIFSMSTHKHAISALVLTLVFEIFHIIFMVDQLPPNTEDTPLIGLMAISIIIETISIIVWRVYSTAVKSNRLTKMPSNTPPEVLHKKRAAEYFVKVGNIILLIGLPIQMLVMIWVLWNMS